MSNFRNGKFFPAYNYDENGQIPVFGSNGQIGNTHFSLNNKPVIIIGRVGACCGSLYRIDQPSWTTDNSIIVESKNNYFEFLYHKLANMNLRQNMGESAQPLLTQSGLGNLVVIIPPSKLQMRFGEVVHTLSFMIHTRKIIIKNLEKISDSLLPKLMSGDLVN